MARREEIVENKDDNWNVISREKKIYENDVLVQTQKEELDEDGKLFLSKEESYQIDSDGRSYAPQEICYDKHNRVTKKTDRSYEKTDLDDNPLLIERSTETNYVPYSLRKTITESCGVYVDGEWKYYDEDTKKSGGNDLKHKVTYYGYNAIKNQKLLLI